MGHLINWFSTQFTLSGPFTYFADKGWIPTEVANVVDSTFFGPLHFAAENFGWFREQLSKVMEAWQHVPF